MILPSALAKVEKAERSNPAAKVLDSLLIMVFLNIQACIHQAPNRAGPIDPEEIVGR